MPAAATITTRLFAGLFDVFAARLGNRRAAAAVGLLALRRGSPRRSQRALARLERDAGDGCGWAAMALAQAYARGYGVPPDIRHSIAYLSIAAVSGHRNAMTTIADCYRNGVGVPKDLGQAAAWERLARGATVTAER